MAGNHGTELRLEDVSRDLHGKIVTCEVNNEIGKSEITKTLEITCMYYNEQLPACKKSQCFIFFFNFQTRRGSSRGPRT